MDCVPGELLIYRLKRCPEIEKELLFEWIRQLLHQLELYHKCRNSQCYRYLNPFSVLVTREDKLLLLDLEAESNEFVLRNMQKRAMRNHFVKPIVHIKENTRLSLDLYGFGKTIQFILASVKTEPSLTKREEKRFENIIKKCLGENPKKQYENLKQIQKELPVFTNRESGKRKKQRIFLIVLIGVLAAAAVTGIKIQRQRGQRVQEQQELQKIETEEIQKDNLYKPETTDGTEGSVRNGKRSEPEDALEVLEEEVNGLNNYLLRNTAKDNEEVIEQGEDLQRELLRYLSAAYDREGLIEKALSAYEMLCEIETQEDLLKAAYLRRIAIEMELQNESRAVQTGQEAVKRFPELGESEVYKKLESEYGILEHGDTDEPEDLEKEEEEYDALEEKDTEE